MTSIYNWYFCFCGLVFFHIFNGWKKSCYTFVTKAKTSEGMRLNSVTCEGIEYRNIYQSPLSTDSCLLYLLFTSEKSQISISRGWQGFQWCVLSESDKGDICMLLRWCQCEVYDIITSIFPTFGSFSVTHADTLVSMFSFYHINIYLWIAKALTS